MKIVFKTLGHTETVEQRNALLADIMKVNAQKWKEMLAKSVAHRSELCLRCDRQGSECDQIKFDFKGFVCCFAHLLLLMIVTSFAVQSDHLIADLHKRMQTYHTHLKSACAESKSVHRKLTGDYLVMRHNAKVAMEVLLRKQQQASAAREVLREKLDAIVNDAAVKREHMSKAAACELNILSEDIRAQVKERERAVKEVQGNITHFKVERKQLRRDLLIMYKTNTRKYQELEARRVQEVGRIEGELNQLRGQINDMQLRLTSLQAHNHRLEEGDDDDDLGSAQQDYLTLKHLQDRWKNLQRGALM